MLFCFAINSANLTCDFPELDEEWKSFCSKKEVICKWIKLKKQEHNISDEFIFYPFGGGDVIYPFSFFPGLKHLVLIGLEPVGKEYVEQDREHIIDNLKHLFSRGFFVTKDMENFAKTGVLTVILIQLKKLGATEVEFEAKKRSEYKTLEIRFTLDGTKRKIEYLKINLKDEYCDKWQAILDEFRDFTLFIKSASFVLQQIGFKKIKLFLADRASCVVQDDTGFAYKEVNNLGFEAHLYGTYFLPYEIKGLKMYYQPDLKLAYEDCAIEKLPYETIGYRGTGVYGNLQILTKRNKKQDVVV